MSDLYKCVMKMNTKEYELRSFTIELGPGSHVIESFDENGRITDRVVLLPTGKTIPLPGGDWKITKEKGREETSNNPAAQ